MYQCLLTHPSPPGAVVVFRTRGRCCLFKRGGGVWALPNSRKRGGIPRRVDLHTKRVVAILVSTLALTPTLFSQVSHAGVVSLSQDPIASAKVGKEM